MDYEISNLAQVRFENACTEKQAVISKLNNPDVPEEKKVRLKERLKQLDEELIPMFRGDFESTYPH